MNKEFKKKNVPASAMRFNTTAVVEMAEGEEGGKKTFRMTPYSGQVFEHPWWGKIAFDVSSMEMRKDKIPARVDHKYNIGVIDTMEKNGLEVSFSGEFIDNQHSAEIFEMQKKGLEYECSVAFDDDFSSVIEVGENASMEVNGEEFIGPGTVMQGPVHEVSFTHYGAVPNTATDFSKDKDQVLLKVFSHFSEEEGSMGKEFTQEDLDNQKKAALSEFKAQLAKIVDITGDKEFAADCVERGISTEEALVEFTKKQSEALEAKDSELSEFKANAEQDDTSAAGRPDGVSFSADDGDGEGEKSFKALVDDIQKKEKGLSRGKAYSRAVREYPEEYKAFRASFTVVNDGRKG